MHDLPTAIGEAQPRSGEHRTGLSGASRPLGRGQIAAAHAWLRSHASDSRFEFLDWAGDDALGFLEWRVTGTRKEAPFTIGIVDRLDCTGGAILHARSYFDTLTRLGS